MKKINKFAKVFSLSLAFVGLCFFLTGCAQETWPKTNVSYTATASNYVFSSDWSRSIAEGKKAGDYDHRDVRITDINFPLMEYDVGNEVKTFILVHFDCSISSENAIKQMKTEGCRPATMRELLVFGEKYPKVQIDYPIVVALGQVARIDGCDRVGCLRRDGAGRGLHLGYFGYDWYAFYRFLGVRN